MDCATSLKDDISSNLSKKIERGTKTIDFKIGGLIM